MGLGVRAPSVSNVYHPTIEHLRHPAQVWPGFDKEKKLNFLPRVNNAKAVQVHLLFVCDFWHRGNFRNTDKEEKYNVGWAQCFMSSADGRDNTNNETQNALA